MNDEKTLVTSVRSERSYRSTLIFIYAIAIGSALLFAIAMGNDAASSVPSWELILNENLKNERFFDSFWTSLFLWGSFFSLPVSVLPHILLHKFYYRQSITVTNQRVKCTSGFKDEMNIPIAAISSVAVNSGIFKSIGLTCAGNRYSIGFIENCKEIYNVINGLVNENRNEKIPSAQPTDDVKVSNANITDEIRKYKQLCDDGIITKEEFEAKKKQLLNL